MKFKKLLFVFAILLSAIVATAASDIPARPEPQRLVNDMAGILSPEQQQTLEQKLVNFFAQTSTQITIVTVKDLAGYDKADFATQIGHNWGIGKKDQNNGILILVKPKTADSRGEVFVAVGYGLEAVVPDAIAHRTLVDTEMIPSFKRNDYYGGLDKATNVLISLTKNEFTAAQYAQKAEQENKGSGGWFLFFLFIFLIPFLLIRRRSYTLGGTRPGSSLPFWGGLALWELMRNHHSGYYNDFSSGSGDFGGGGSSFSDFGGFGGGDFGGGGAGGSW